MIVAFTSPVSTGASFMDWSFNWLLGESNYWHHKYNFIELVSNPLTNRNAHGHKANHPLLVDVEKFIEIETKKNNPFCLMIGYPDPHPPYSKRPPYDKEFNPEDMPVPISFNDANFRKKRGYLWNESVGITEKDLEKQNRISKPMVNLEQMKLFKSSYCSMVKLIDKNVGRLIKKLKDLNIYENTLFIFTTDHGEYMGEHGLMGKDHMLESAYRIPFLMSLPKKIKKHNKNNFLWSNVDFAPTLLELLEIQTKYKFEGKSRAKQFISAEKCLQNNEEYVFLERRNDSARYEVVAAINYEYWYGLRADGKEIFFDRINDKDQRNNLSNDSSILKIKNKLQKVLLNHHLRFHSMHSKWLQNILIKDP